MMKKFNEVCRKHEDTIYMLDLVLAVVTVLMMVATVLINDNFLWFMVDEKTYKLYEFIELYRNYTILCNTLEGTCIVALFVLFAVTVLTLIVLWVNLHNVEKEEQA